jgi:hypothetical protein
MAGEAVENEALVRFVVLEFSCIFSFLTRERGNSKEKQGKSHQKRKNNNDVHQGRGGHGKCDHLVTPPMQENDKWWLEARGMADKGVKGWRSE